MRAEDPVEKIHACSTKYQFFRKKPTVPPAVPNSDIFVDASVTVYLIHTNQGSPDFWERTTYAIPQLFEGQHIAQYDCFGIYYILPNQQFFRKYSIFSLLAKYVLQPDENGFAGQIWPEGRSVENPDIDYKEKWWEHTPLSECNTNAERLWFNYVDTGAFFSARIQLLDGQQEAPITPYSRDTPQSFFQGPRPYPFRRLIKHMYTSSACSPDFSKNCWRLEICFVVVRPRRKPHWISSSFGSIHWATNFWSCFFYFDFLVFLDVFWCAESENDVSFFVGSAVFL